MSKQQHSSVSSASSPASPSRRRWLARSGASVASVMGAASVGNLMLGAKPAHAADYKALVCIFLYGGNDGMNTIVPTDSTRYGQYANVRQTLALPRSSLVNLDGIDYGLHPSMAALAPAWSDGALSPVFNVGVLSQSLSKAEFRAASAASSLMPDTLFSHAAQQTQWETATTTSMARTGWGGRACVTLNTANPVISVGGATRFGQSDTQPALVLPGLPGELFGAYRLQPQDLTWDVLADRKASLDLLYSSATQDTALAEAYSAVQRNAFTVSNRLSGLAQIAPHGPGANAVIDAAFAPLIGSDNTVTTELGRQLYQVAKLILGNATVQGNRQIFYAKMEGFDSHANQIVTGSPTEGVHAKLLKELGDALACFYTAMKNLGMSDAVTAFTQSDFGRTFAPNLSNGTDHGWGNHHLVLGGAVKGGKSYGVYPDLALGGITDIGVDSWERQGRWLPTTSVDQYAATLLNWFGANDTQLNQILPNLGNYAVRRLGFV